MTGADLLVLLSDVDGLYTADTRHSPDARHIPHVKMLTDEIMAMGGDANAETGVGSGGMATKLMAAKIAVSAGCDMIICDGREEGPLQSLADGGKHTLFKSSQDPKNARSQWIASSLVTSGHLIIDQGAETALQNGRSLLAVGLTSMTGEFGKGDTVSVLNQAGKELARGLSSYDSRDLTPICGLRSEDITHPAGPVVIHRDNLVLL